MTLRPLLLAVATSLLASTSAAQQAAPPVAQAAPAPQPLPPSDYEEVRFRGGFNIGGGYAFGAAQGPIIDLTVRLGVQLGRVGGIAFQTQPNIFLIGTSSGVVGGFGINNSLLGELTFFDFLQLGLGPSFDFLAAAACSVGDTSCSAAAGTGFGVHARAAIIFAGRDPRGGRRGGFSISVNLHPMFLGNGSFLFFSTLGLGGDWF